MGCLERVSASLFVYRKQTNTYRNIHIRVVVQRSCNVGYVYGVSGMVVHVIYRSLILCDDAEAPDTFQECVYNLGVRR